MVKKCLKGIDTVSFELPAEALRFIEEQDYSGTEGKIILFLDLNMPLITGWEFLERFDTYGDEIKKHFSIYILSSSVDDKDKRLAEKNPYVKDFISKPIDAPALQKVYEGEG
jgi:CheY-like chemotaxis protein